VILAQNGGVPPLGTAALYFLSDIFLAFTAEPFLAFVRWLARRIPALARVGDVLTRFSAKAGLRGEGARGPLELILVSFAVSPMTGRAAAAAAGHGFVPGWALAITGDMAYFVVLMVSTLWLHAAVGDDRLTIGLMLGVSLLLPLLLRRFGRSRSKQELHRPVDGPVLAPLTKRAQRRARKRPRAVRQAPDAAHLS